MVVLDIKQVENHWDRACIPRTPWHYYFLPNALTVAFPGLCHLISSSALQNEWRLSKPRALSLTGRICVITWSEYGLCPTWNNMNCITHHGMRRLTSPSIATCCKLLEQGHPPTFTSSDLNLGHMKIAHLQAHNASRSGSAMSLYYVFDRSINYQSIIRSTHTAFFPQVSRIDN